MHQNTIERTRIESSRPRSACVAALLALFACQGTAEVDATAPGEGPVHGNWDDQRAPILVATFPEIPLGFHQTQYADEGRTYGPEQKTAFEHIVDFYVSRGLSVVRVPAPTSLADAASRRNLVYAARRGLRLHLVLPVKGSERFYPPCAGSTTCSQRLGYIRAVDPSRYRGYLDELLSRFVAWGIDGAAIAAFELGNEIDQAASGGTDESIGGTTGGCAAGVSSDIKSRRYITAFDQMPTRILSNGTRAEEDVDGCTTEWGLRRTFRVYLDLLRQTRAALLAAPPSAGLAAVPVLTAGFTGFEFYGVAKQRAAVNMFAPSLFWTFLDWSERHVYLRPLADGVAIHMYTATNEFIDFHLGLVHEAFHSRPESFPKRVYVTEFDSGGREPSGAEISESVRAERVRLMLRRFREWQQGVVGKSLQFGSAIHFTAHRLRREDVDLHRVTDFFLRGSDSPITAWSGIPSSASLEIRARNAQVEGNCLAVLATWNPKRLVWRSSMDSRTCSSVCGASSPPGDCVEARVPSTPAIAPLMRPGRCSGQGATHAGTPLACLCRTTYGF